jgi:hypothetical protein
MDKILSLGMIDAVPTWDDTADAAVTSSPCTAVA